MFKKFFILACMTAFGFTSVVSAQEEDSGSDINPWQHCGIGAMLFSDNETAAVISNIIWDLGTTAVSSKVSSQGSCKGAAVQTAMFINESYDKLAEETAAGQGEHLTAMMDIMQCDATSRDDFVTVIRANFATEFSKEETATMDRTEKAEQYFNIVHDQFKSDFKSSCSAI